MKSATLVFVFAVSSAVVSFAAGPLPLALVGEKQHLENNASAEASVDGNTVTNPDPPMTQTATYFTSGLAPLNTATANTGPVTSAGGGLVTAQATSKSTGVTYILKSLTGTAVSLASLADFEGTAEISGVGAGLPPINWATFEHSTGKSYVSTVMVVGTEPTDWTGDVEFIADHPMDGAMTCASVGLGGLIAVFDTVDEEWKVVKTVVGGGTAPVYDTGGEANPLVIAKSFDLNDYFLDPSKTTGIAVMLDGMTPLDNNGSYDYDDRASTSSSNTNDSASDESFCGVRITGAGLAD